MEADKLWMVLTGDETNAFQNLHSFVAKYSYPPFIFMQKMEK